MKKDALISINILILLKVRNNTLNFIKCLPNFAIFLEATCITDERTLMI